jgi:hypothetical protein
MQGACSEGPAGRESLRNCGARRNMDAAGYGLISGSNFGVTMVICVKEMRPSGQCGTTTSRIERNLVRAIAWPRREIRRGRASIH